MLETNGKLTNQAVQFNPFEKQSEWQRCIFPVCFRFEILKLVRISYFLAVKLTHPTCGFSRTSMGMASGLGGIHSPRFFSRNPRRSMKPCVERCQRRSCRVVMIDTSGTENQLDLSKKFPILQSIHEIIDKTRKLEKRKKERMHLPLCELAVSKFLNISIGRSKGRSKMVDLEAMNAKEENTSWQTRISFCKLGNLFVIAKVLNKLNYLMQFRFIVGISSDRFVHVDVVEFEVQSVDQTVDWFIWKKSEF